MRSACGRPSLAAMTTDLFMASMGQGGGPMMGALLAIALVGGIVYLVRGRRRSDRGRANDRSPDASNRSREE
jgi:hypothetical protein